jgi:transcription-repair coupling factor (superfamily II helicase)
MSDAARCEWWGDELNSLWVFDLTSQRSIRQIDEITILPVAVPDPAGRDALAVSSSRQSLLELLPSDTLIIEEAAGPDRDEVLRAWREAEHHLEVARRLGEDVPSRAVLFEEPDGWQQRLEGFPRLLLGEQAAPESTGT